MTQKQVTLANRTVTTDKWMVKLVKRKSFVESRQARQRLAERQKQEKADRVREERERDKERQVRRKPMQKGFRVNRSGDEFTDEETSDERKRPRPSPGVSGPESKSSRKFSPGHDHDPDYSSQGGSRGDPTGK